MASGDMICDFSGVTAKSAYGDQIDAPDEAYRGFISMPKGLPGAPVDWRTFIGYTHASLGSSGNFTVEVMFRVSTRRRTLASGVYTGGGDIRWAAAIKPLADSAVTDPTVSGGTMVAATTTLDATAGEIKVATLTITYAQAGSLDKNKPFVLRIGRDSGNALDTVDAPVEIVGLCIKQA